VVLQFRLRGFYLSDRRSRPISRSPNPANCLAQKTEDKYNGHDDGNVEVVGGYGHIRLGPRALHNTVSTDELDGLPSICAQVWDNPEGYPVINAWVVDEVSYDPYDMSKWVTLLYADYVGLFSNAGYDKDASGRDILSKARYFERVGPFFMGRSFDWWATLDVGWLDLPATEPLTGGFYPDDPTLYPDPGGTPVTLPDKNWIPEFGACP
jgi:hypothetical protein